jgi:uncharacterized protein YecE (DUF72 family)
MFRERFSGGVVVEPRHKSWFTPAAGEILRRFHIARVAADPAVVPDAGEPGGWEELKYYRLHGSPRVYWSEYSPDYLARLAERLTSVSTGHDTWCIFDNTAHNWATPNALDLRDRICRAV